MEKIYTSITQLAGILLLSLLLLQNHSASAQSSWTRKADALKKRGECPSVVYKNKIYVFGGFGEHPNFEKIPEMYDPVANKWTLLASFPAGKEISHQGVVLVDDKVWHIGGRATNADGPVSSQVIIYNITTNSWSNGPQLKDPATGQALPLGGGGAALLGRTIHVFGGFGPTICNDQDKYHLTLDVDKYLSDPANTKWENKSAPMPIKRNHLNTAVLGGKIYAIGGQFIHDCGGKDQKYVHAYDPITNSWTQLTNLPVERSHSEGATFALDGKIYLVGGQGAGGVAANTVYVLDPAGNSGKGSWSTATKFQLPTGYYGISAKVIGSSFIISHGAITNITNERRETYTASITRSIPNKFGFAAACFSKTASLNQKQVFKNLLFTIEGEKQYNLTSSASWLKITKNATGISKQTGTDIEITIDAAGLSTGNYTGTVTATGTGTGPAFTAASFCVNLRVGTSTGQQEVVSFNLINANSDQSIQQLTDGATLNLATLPTKSLNIQAVTNPATVGSVKLVLSGPQSRTQTESGSPYALFPESGGNYSGWTPAIGSYKLTATPYSASGGTGTAGISKTINFTVVNQVSDNDDLVNNIRATSGRSYILSELVPGTALYTDRTTHNVTSVPNFLNQAPFIRTPNDDKANTSTSLLSFNLTKDATVYVAYDPRGTVLPAWLSNWQKLTNVIGINDPDISTLNLYSKTFPAGTVTLGGTLASPAAGARSSYIVVVQAAGAATSSGLRSVKAASKVVEKENGEHRLKMQVFPNPTNQNSSIQIALTNFDQLEKVTVTLQDALGRVTASKIITTNEQGAANTEIKNINRPLIQGVYIVKAHAKSGHIQGKVLVVK